MQLHSETLLLPFGEVAVVSTESAQVREIRQALRNIGLSQVIVERVQNVQGKEFGALFISPVMDHKTRGNKGMAIGLKWGPPHRR